MGVFLAFVGIVTKAFAFMAPYIFFGGVRASVVRRLFVSGPVCLVSFFLVALVSRMTEFTTRLVTTFDVCERPGCLSWSSFGLVCRWHCVGT